MSFVPFSLDRHDTGTRLQLAFTLVLTGVAFRFVGNQYLPTLSYTTILVSRDTVTIATVISTFRRWLGRLRAWRLPSTISWLTPAESNCRSLTCSSLWRSCSSPGGTYPSALTWLKWYVYKWHLFSSSYGCMQITPMFVYIYIYIYIYIYTSICQWSARFYTRTHTHVRRVYI
jgi:hypothetical protein